jgi:hypothetical protein
LTTTRGAWRLGGATPWLLLLLQRALCPLRHCAHLARDCVHHALHKLTVQEANGCGSTFECPMLRVLCTGRARAGVLGRRPTRYQECRCRLCTSRRPPLPRAALSRAKHLLHWLCVPVRSRLAHKLRSMQPSTRALSPYELQLCAQPGALQVS